MKNKMLKVTGILMIIGSALGLILGIIAIAAVAALLSYTETIDPTLASAAIAEAGINYPLLIVAGIIALVGAVVELITGILGVKFSTKPEKAKVCLVWGILVAAFTVFSNILSIVGGNPNSFVTWITGLVLPVLYIIGACQSIKACESLNANAPASEAEQNIQE